MALDITLLGPPQVERDGARVAFDTRKAMALLAHLALTRGPRSRDALCGLLWPAHDPDHARGALRRTLSTLRGTIGDQWIDTTGDTIALKRGPDLELDVERFRALAADNASLESLSAAVALHSGSFLEGFSLRDSHEFDDWQAREADTLGRELSSALRRMVEMLAAGGEYERALPLARRWLDVDPLHEPAHRELIRLYAWSGDRAAALEQYRECVRTLTQELGVSPLDETSKLFEQVNEGTLEPPDDTRVPAAPGPSHVREGANGFGELPLVGRNNEMSALRGAHAGATPDGELAVIEGEAGIGKTRLATELLAHVRGENAVVLAARCHDDEAGLPYGPVVELLRQAMEITGGEWPEHLPKQRLADASLLLPELGAPEAEPVTLEGPGGKVRLLEGVAGVIAAACEGPKPGVVFVDDVHAADQATLDVIAFLGRRLRGRSLLLTIAWRSEAVPPGHRLRGLAADLAHDGRITIVNPRRLDEQEVAMLVRTVDSKAADLAHRVFVESEGLPLFCAEYLAALGASADPTTAAFPAEVRSILDARLGGLGDVARQVLSAASVIGGSFDLETVRHASGRSEEEVVSGLDELVAQGIVKESSSADLTYGFSHQKLRALVYEQTSLARRRLLHARAATALSRRLPVEENAAVVASHLRLAGDTTGAAERYRIAAEHASSLHAHADALEYLEAALALGAGNGVLHERIGDTRTLLGDYVGALASYDAAAAQADVSGSAGIEHKVGNVHLRRGEWSRAETRFAAALDSAPVDDAGLRARVQADLALALNHSGRSGESEAFARDALTLAESAGDPRALAQAHNMLGVLARNSGKLPSARAELEASLELARKLRDEPAQAAALNNLALVERDSGELARALELTESALRLCADYGDRHRQAALENNLADLHHALGDEDAAMTHLKRAVAIFSEVGADEATRLPEIWKLVSW
jgi:DNA-binding SARP family transcriptional activator